MRILLDIIKGSIIMFRVHKSLMTIVAAICLFSVTPPLSAQVSETQTRYIRIGSLQSRFTAIGSERAWNNVYYEGLTWPSDYLLQDNAVIERTFMGCMDFTDSKGQHWDRYCHNVSTAFASVSIFPMVIKQTAKFPNPMVNVDGVDISAPYTGDVDAIDPNQIADRIVTNIVNTSMGITMTRKVHAFSQQYHDNYFIIEYTFKNTGYVSAENKKVLDATVKGFRFGFMNRYSVCREGADKMGYDQEYGKHSWVTRRGEDYPQHAGEVANLTESSPLPTWLRAGFEWTGQRDLNAYDNIGSPDILKGTGRLCSPQHAGIVTLHVDKSTSDRADDVNQPAVLGWHAGDTYPSLGDMSLSTAPLHNNMYDLLSGTPYKGIGNGNPSQRFDEAYMATVTDPYKVHGDGGGTGLWIGYGPWDIAPGDSVVLVLAVGVSGLDRTTCWQIGKRWYQAYQNASDLGPFTLPNGSTTTDENVYKNTWVYTGKDSIMQTFSRAVRNYELGYNIPQAPQPPSIFTVTSGGDRISLTWDPSPSESEAGFGGYKIFRAVGTPDTVFNEIASLGPGSKSFDDVTAQRGFSYYYYICAFSDGSNNATGKANPTGRLLSSRFYTKTNYAAYLRRAQGPQLGQDMTDSIPMANVNLVKFDEKDSLKNVVEFRIDPQFADKYVNVAITDFSITIIDTAGYGKTIAPPEGMLPVHLSTDIDSTTSFQFELDSNWVKTASKLWYKVRTYNSYLPDAIEITLNGTRINLPASTIPSFNKWIDAIRIVPNPYNIRSAELQYTGEPDKIMFLNIPGHCLIRIYTENGDLINTIEHENGSGDERWNSNTFSGQVVVSGVYIVHFTVTEDFTDPLTGEVRYRKGDTAYQKCIIIR